MKLEVHIDFRSKTELVGQLFAAERGSVAFEYAREWLERKDAFPIDPNALPLQRGFLRSAGLCGAIQDCGPDRWGRMLIERAVRKKLLAQKPYHDIDYVVALDDAARIGALRFRPGPDTAFLAATSGRLPPVVQLGALLNATEAILRDSETVDDLKFLLGAGSPLGGARPKSAVVLRDGSLGMAKFPKPDDRRDIAAGEILALNLAEEAGINVPIHELLTVDRHSVAVIKRFDRKGQQRIPFISGVTLLGAGPNETGSYTQLAEAIRRFGDNVAEDLEQLWRRLVFSLLISNRDDHLRNHGFLMLTPGKWSLSPAYDVNPVPEIEHVYTSTTPISESAHEGIEGCLEVADRFALALQTARAILKQVKATVKTWRAVARRMGLKRPILETYATAFRTD